VLAHRAAREKLTRKRTIDDDHRRRAGATRGREFATSEQPGTNRGEVVVADVDDGGRGRLLTRRYRPVRDLKTVHLTGAAKRRVLHGRGRLHAGEASHLLNHGLVVIHIAGKARPGGIDRHVVTIGVDRELHRHEPVLTKTRVDVEERDKAARHQSRAHHQHHRHGNFRDDEGVAQSLRVGPDGATPNSRPATRATTTANSTAVGQPAGDDGHLGFHRILRHARLCAGNHVKCSHHSDSGDRIIWNR